MENIAWGCSKYNLAGISSDVHVPFMCIIEVLIWSHAINVCIFPEMKTNPICLVKRDSEKYSCTRVIIHFCGLKDYFLRVYI